MRDIVIAGGHFHTTRDVAEAVLLYELALRRSGTCDIVTIPIVADGRLRHCALVLGGTDVASADSPPDGPDTLTGSAEAAARMQDLAAELIGQSGG